jgi:hypothetical protein
MGLSSRAQHSAYGPVLTARPLGTRPASPVRPSVSRPPSRVRASVTGPPSGATFGDAAQFANVIFGNDARFEGVGFGGRAYFTSATFGGDATFTGAAFGLLANFDKAHFKGQVNFTGKSPEQWAKEIARADGMDEEVRAALEKRHRESWELNGSGPERFSITSFANTRFDRWANFSSRTFGLITVFTGARFYLPPSRCCCAHFEKSRRKPRTTISNATSISRNARPNAASIFINVSKR